MRNVPELRFDGYDGEWEEKKLSKIAKFSKGKGYSKTDLKNSGNPIYLYGEMYTNYKSQINDVETFTDKIKANSVLSKGNEVLIPSSGETAIDLARASHMNIPKVLLGGDLNIIEPINGFDPHFLALELSNGTIKQSLAKKAQGKSVVHLYNTDIKNQKVNYPIIDEQEKIGSLFRKIDALIEIQEGKVSKMEDFKKSMLQKMFPKKDELVPEFRFDGFDGEWEIKKIKELASVKTGKSDTKDADDNGIYPFYIRSDEPVKSSKYLYDEEAVLTIGDGQIGKVFFYVNGKYDLHQRVYRIFDFTDYIDPKYFYHYFSRFFLRRAMMLSAKGTVDSVRMEMITGMEIKIPQIKEEQIKIRRFLENIDSQIENEEKLLDSYKMMKKSLLQKMFV